MLIAAACWLREVGRAVAAEVVRAAAQWRGGESRVRDVIADHLRRAEQGLPSVSQEDEATAGSAGAARATMLVRATRAPRTDAAAQRAVREVRSFLIANPSLLRVAGAVSHTHWDVLLEAFTFAEAARGTRACPWQRARRPQDPSAARLAATARAFLERTGHAQPGTWARSKAIATAFGVRDADDVRHHPPIFAWELVEGFRLRPAPATPWEMAAAALLVVAALNARSKESCTGLLVEEVEAAGACEVRVSAAPRAKVTRVRATQRPRLASRPVALRHWLVRSHVIPWLEWHRRHGSPGSALLFPAIYAKKPRNGTAQGFLANGQWVEPMRRWPDRAVVAAMERYVHNLGGRTFHGFRGGNNRELRRRADVSVVTRRLLHERTLRPVVGSEEAYDEPFAEDYASATAALGRLRIERAKDGLLTVTASSASAGEDPRDWVAAAGAAAAPKAVADMSSSDSDGSGDDSEVVAAAGSQFDCQRCGRHVSLGDYGWLCDEDGCAWGVCTRCHPGGARAPLRCPEHDRAT